MKTFFGKLLGVGLGVAIWLLPCVVQAQPVVTNQPVNQTVVYGGNATFSVMVTGSGPFTYQWRLNGTNLPNNRISTVAGGKVGQQVYGLAGTNTIMNSPQGAAVDSVGNVFIADSFNHIIIKLRTNGLMVLVAGNRSASFSGDGGLATSAGLWAPAAVALDNNNNLFIADWGNNRIRKVDTHGVITTFAGSSASSLGDNGQATNASLSFPSGLAFDTAGNLFIADSGNNRIRKVNTSGIITTVAGTGIPGSGGGSMATSAQLNFPDGVAVDTAGNLYIADTSNYKIRKVNSSGSISVFAGTGAVGYSGDGGSATAAKLGTVDGLTVDTKGNVFVADSGNHCIRKITNGIITTVAGNGVMGFAGDGALAANANLAFPYSVAADSTGNLYVLDTGNNRVRKVGTDGVVSTVAGRDLNDGASATAATLNGPWSVARDNAGNLFISDTANSRIRKVDTNGIISTFAGNGIPGFAGDGGLATNASLVYQYGIAIDGTGNVFIADRVNFRVRKVDTNGYITTVAGKGSAAFSGDGGAATNAGLYPISVAVDYFGNIFIAEVPNRIRKVDTNGTITTVAGNGSYSYSGDGGLATSAGVLFPNTMAVDTNGNLFIADSSYRIRKVNSAGIITTVVGNGTNGYSGDGGQATNAQINPVYGLAIDASGYLLIADTFNNRIRKVETNGIITTIVGNGVQGLFGDNGSASGAKLSLPRGISIDAAGNLLIADWGNNRIRQVNYLEYADQPSFTLNNVTPASMGNYSVVITSASGSVTSSVVSVNVQLPPIAPTFTASNGVCQFTWSAVSNLTYQLQSATNLTTPNWQDLGSPITATNNAVSAADAVGADGQRFYRVRLWP